MTTCTFIYLEQQWAQNVLPVCLFNYRLEETKLFINKLPKYFNESECKLIMELLKRYMDDGLCFGHQLLHDRGPYDIEISPLIC